ncbi:MAG TPA: DUF1801 domain-containing protein [Ktedonobacteraceae bacterium]
MNVSTPSEEVRVWLEHLPSEKKPTVETLRRLIGSVAPEAHEIIYHDALGYGPTDSGFDRIVYVTVFEKHLNLGFFFGGFLPDTERLLVGSGKRMRHLKIRSVQEAENPAITRLLARAWVDGLKRVEQLHRRSI